MECGICYELFSADPQSPQYPITLVACGHTFCASDLKQLAQVSENKSGIKCPLDHIVSSKLCPPNRGLIEMIELQNKQITKWQISGQDRLLKNIGQKNEISFSIASWKMVLAEIEAEYNILEGIHPGYSAARAQMLVKCFQIPSFTRQAVRQGLLTDAVKGDSVMRDLLQQVLDSNSNEVLVDCWQHLHFELQHWLLRLFTKMSNFEDFVIYLTSKVSWVFETSHFIPILTQMVNDVHHSYELYRSFSFKGKDFKESKDHDKYQLNVLVGRVDWAKEPNNNYFLSTQQFHRCLKPLVANYDQEWHLDHNKNKIKPANMNREPPRRLCWRLDQGRAEVEVTFPNGVVCLCHVSTCQMLLLELFNFRVVVSLDDMVQKCRMPRQFLFDQASLLAQAGVLEMQTQITNPDLDQTKSNDKNKAVIHRFRLHRKFDLGTYEKELKVPNHVSIQKRNTIAELLMRRYLERLIVWIMKRCKKDVEHCDLVTIVLQVVQYQEFRKPLPLSLSVCSALRPPQKDPCLLNYKIKPSDIRKHIKALVEQKYLSVHQDEKTRYYSYVP
jgi:hypothetical protein